MRLYWACTHTTLRNTEVPLLIESGFEVVPEEANVDIVTPDDALAYDADVGFTRLWKKGCTLSADHLRYVRRARLVQRNGLISEAERELFNALFDVIYIPSFLEIAANVKSWFNGEVIFRYFGVFANLRSLEDQCGALDPELVRRICCAPIFSTLVDAKMATRFARTMVVHAVINADDAPPPWGGVRREQSAVLVTYPLYEGQEVLERARELIPLARKIPITVLGRNDPSLVPDDIKRAFHLNGSSDRTTHFQRMSDARLILYPNSSSLHMHYVPLEALSAGIPLVCRDTIPLIAEYKGAGGNCACMPGIAHSADDFVRMAEAMYFSPDELPGIAHRQAFLPIRFQRESVLNEIGLLKANLNLRGRRQLSDISATSPLARLPTVRSLAARREFPVTDSTFPISDLVIDLPNTAVEFSGIAPPFDVSVVAKQGAPVKLMLGFLDAPRFAAGLRHEVWIHGSLRGEAHVLVGAELWQDNEIVYVDSGGVDHARSGDPQKIGVRFFLDAPSSLLVTLTVIGTGSAKFVSVAHRLGGVSSLMLELLGDVSGRASVDQRIRSREGVGAAIFGAQWGLSAYRTNNASHIAFLVGSERRMLSLQSFGLHLEEGDHIFIVTVAGSAGSVLEVLTETWTSQCEGQLNTRVRIGTNEPVEVEALFSSPAGKRTIPVFYFRSIDGESIAVLRLRLTRPASFQS